MRVVRAARDVLPVLGLAAALCLITALAVVVLPFAPFPELSVEEQSSTVDVPVLAQTLDRRRAVELRLEWSGDHVATAAGSGLVTEMYVRTGTGARCGAPVMALDGRPVIAYCAKRPPFRTLTATTTGADGDDLWGYLSELKLLGENSTAAQRRAAISKFRSDRGLGRGSTLDPADLLWFPHAGTIGAVNARAGQQVGVGADIVTVFGQVVRAQIVEPPIEPAPTSFVLEVDGLDQPLAIGADGELAEPTALTAAAIQAAESEDRPASVDATIRMADPVSGWSVPAAALHADEAPDGSRACVGVRTGDDVRTVPVEVVGYSLGAALVLGDLGAGDSVVVGPTLRC